MLETGRVLNQYEIVKHLGTGGTGEVYLNASSRYGTSLRAISLCPSGFG